MSDLGTDATQVLNYLAAQYGDAWELLLDGADTAMRNLWLAVGGTSPEALALWEAQATVLMAGVTDAAASGAAAWLDLQVSAMGGQVPPATAIVAPSSPAVISAPPKRLLSHLAAGLDYAEAMLETANYVGRLTSTATRAAEQAGRAARAPDVVEYVPRSRTARRRKQNVLYVRVPDVRACGWCRVVADRLYTEEGVKGSWHAFCRCTWRLATPNDMLNLGQYDGGRWKDVIKERAVADDVVEAVDVPAPPQPKPLPTRQASDLGGKGSRSLHQHPDVQALPDGEGLLWQDLPADSSIAPINYAHVVKRNGFVVVEQIDGTEFTRRAALPDGSTFISADAQVTLGRMENAMREVPEGARYLRQTTISSVKNPDDAYWAQQYGIPNFTSGATGGATELTSYLGKPPSLATVRHEFGHMLDIAGGSSPRIANSAGWQQAMKADAAVSGAIPSGYLSTGPAGLGERFPVLGNPLGVTSYPITSKAPAEDFAEATRLLLQSDRDGYMMEVDGVRYTFDQVFPGRAAVLRQALSQGTLTPGA